MRKLLDNNFFGKTNGMLRLNSRKCHNSSSSGFSLVEVSLALLIIGVAMLSILGMFPMGLEQNTRSIADTHAALFAEEVFSSLRVHAEANWDGIGNSIVSVSAAAANSWDDQVSLDTKFDDEIHTNLYRYPEEEGNTNIIDHVIRYRAALNTNGLIKSVFLRIWPGEFGTTSNPSLFYSEFYRSSQ